MPSSHDLRQDQRIDQLYADVDQLRRRANSNARKIKQLSAALASPAPQSGPDAPAPPKPQARQRTPARRKTPGKGAKVK